MYDCIRKILHAVSVRFSWEKEKPQPLRVKGVTITLTPEPDDEELAAKALLEKMAARRDNDITSSRDKEEKGAAYYHQMAERVREGRALEARLATRYVAYCEEELKKMDDGRGKTEGGRLADLERELYRRMDIVEREGGELKSRWQKCLAEVTVRGMALSLNEK